MMRRWTVCVHVIAMVCGVTHADVVLDWNAETLAAIRAEKTSPPKAARALAMVHIAMFDAMEVINENFETYTHINIAASEATPDGAASVAAHHVLVALFPTQAEGFNVLLDASSPGPEDLAVGQAVAQAVLDARADDGSDAVVGYTPGSALGDWQPTPPAFAAALLPEWPNVKPFCLSDVIAFRRPGPPLLTSTEYTTTFNETKLLGEKNSTARTAEQTQVALFWADGAGTATPPGHWFQIARDVAIQKNNTTEQNARLFALIALAVADAGITSWDNKYAYNDWRPVTAIRNADLDDNPDTIPDPNWTPLLATPPFPSYISGHSTFSGAASKILALFYGTDEVEFTTTSDDVPGVTRHFTRFSQAANEAGRSRIYGGIHWEYDNQDGLSAGRELAVQVYDTFLTAKDSSLLTIPASEIQRCGSIGIVPLGFMMLSLVALRRK